MDEVRLWWEGFVELEKRDSESVYMLRLLLLLLMVMMMVMQIQYRAMKRVSPAVYLVQVLYLSPARVLNSSSYLVPQALVNVLPKQQDQYLGEFIS